MKELPAIIWHEVVDSTNSVARRHMAELDNLSVIAAVSQTAGRGQGDHTWTSEPGENLTFTVVFKFAQDFLHARDSLLITQVTTLALRRLLASKGIDCRIKWPNDIYVGDMKKICGILIENNVSGTSVMECIIGIGLNVNQAAFPEDLPNPVSMFQMTGQRYDTHALLEEFQQHMRDALLHLDSTEGRLYLDKEFQAKVFTLPSAER